jgi:hypothetical protein
MQEDQTDRWATTQPPISLESAPTLRTWQKSEKRLEDHLPPYHCRGFSFSTWIAATSSEPFQEGLLEASQQAMVDLLNSLDMLGSCASFLRAISPVLRTI